MTLSPVVDLLEKDRADGRCLGAQLYVSKDGETLLDHCVGEARPGAPLRPDTLMRWYCAGKPTLALGVCLLLDDHGLSLDVPVASIVPEYAAHGKDAVSLRDLLSHDVPYQSETAERFVSRLDHPAVLAAICAAGLRPATEKGEVGRYSRTHNYAMLGEIVRRLDGRPVASYLRQEVFVPLGMHDTWAAMGEAELAAYGPERRAATYVTRSGRASWSGRRTRRLRRVAFADRPDVLGFSLPGMSMWGPAGDLGRFYEAILAARAGRHDLLPAAVARGMTTPARDARYERVFDFPMAWGLGFQTLMWPLFGQFLSFDTFGHDGMNAALGLADPSLGLVVVHVVNAMDDDRRRSWRELLDTIYRALGHDSSPHARAGATAPAYAGTGGVVLGACRCGTCEFRVKDYAIETT